MGAPNLADARARPRKLHASHAPRREALAAPDPRPPARAMEGGEIPSVIGAVILDGDGRRVVSRYYKSHFASSAEELAFEKKLFDKTSRTAAKSEAEVIVLDGLVSVYRNSCDVWFFIVGSQSENELILAHVLHALYESLASVLHGPPEKRMLLDSFDTLLLVVDEIFDQGLILETDAATIVNRVTMRAPDGKPAEEAFSEGNLNSMFASAREQLARSLLK